MPTMNDIADIFTGMASRFQPDKASGVDATIQFDLSGDNGGLYWVKVENGTCVTGTGQADSPKMTIKAAAEDWHKIAHGEMNAMQAFMGGKIKIQGDMSLALKMQSMFGM
jgi:putative sterol carrier protein